MRAPTVQPSWFGARPAAEATAGLTGLVKEHSAWLASNCQRQLANYRHAPTPCAVLDVPPISRLALARRVHL